jgi:single-strand DNA-binding protein
MRVREVQLLGRKGENSGGPGMDSMSPSRQQAPAPASMDDVADDLPF